MSTINTYRESKALSITVHGAFNLRTVRMIKSRLAPGIDKLNINLINCDLIDSEGIIFLHQWLDRNNELKLTEPPPIMYEILDILKLDNAWELDNILNN